MKTSAKNLLKKIAARQPHRASQATYDELVLGGFARYESPFNGGSGWVVTEAGRKELELEVAK